MGYIYKITNNINNKIYIGQTIRSLEKRWKEHIFKSKSGDHMNLPLARAIRKYGAENFTISLIEEVADEELNDREKYYINYYDSYHTGYNATLGGDGGIAHTISDEEAKKILSYWNEHKTISAISQLTGHSSRCVKRIILTTGISDEEYQQQIKINKRLAWEEQHQKTQELKLQAKEQQRLEKKKQKAEELRERRINLFSVEQQNKIFEMFGHNCSISEITKVMNVNRYDIVNFLAYFFSEEEIYKNAGRKTSCSKPIYQYDSDGNLVYCYKNRIELENEGWTASQIKIIQNAITTPRKKHHAYQYYWFYEECGLEEFRKLLAH